MNWFWYCRECGEGVRMVSMPPGVTVSVRHVEQGLHELRLAGAEDRALRSDALAVAT